MANYNSIPQQFNSVQPPLDVDFMGKVLMAKEGQTNANIAQIDETLGQLKIQESMLIGSAVTFCLSTKLGLYSNFRFPCKASGSGAYWSGSAIIPILVCVEFPLSKPAFFVSSTAVSVLFLSVVVTG